MENYKNTVIQVKELPVAEYLIELAYIDSYIYNTTK